MPGMHDLPKTSKQPDCSLPQRRGRWHFAPATFPIVAKPCCGGRDTHGTTDGQRSQISRHSRGKYTPSTTQLEHYHEPDGPTLSRGLQRQQRRNVFDIGNAGSHFVMKNNTHRVEARCCTLPEPHSTPRLPRPTCQSQDHAHQTNTGGVVGSSYGKEVKRGRSIIGQRSIPKALPPPTIWPCGLVTIFRIQGRYLSFFSTEQP